MFQRVMQRVSILQNAPTHQSKMFWQDENKWSEQTGKPIPWCYTSQSLGDAAIVHVNCVLHDLKSRVKP